MSLVSMTIKVQPNFRDDFAATAEALGMPAATALKILAKRFIEEGGFPFEVRVPRINIDPNDPRIIQTYHKDGKLMMPAAWRDEDDQDDVDDEL